MEFDDDSVNDIEYLVWSKEFVQSSNRGEVDEELRAKIRLAASDDRIHLKGDYCIKIAELDLENKNLRKEVHGKLNRNVMGKKFKATEALIRSVFRNHKTKAFPVYDFCMLTGISKNKYYRIINQDIGDVKTIQYLKSIQNQIENE